MVRIVSRSLAVASALATATALATTPSVSAQPQVGWSRETLTQPTGAQLSAALVVDVAAGPEGYVAIGGRACSDPTRGRARSRCWGQAWTSSDGVSWSSVDPKTSGLDLGVSVPVTSGPEVGLGGVAFGPEGYLAFGRAGQGSRGRQTTAVWRSDDGRSWERVTARRDFPTGTRLRTILGADDGYLLGGVVYRKRAPQAAIWSSRDGRTWTLASGRDDFDIGGYIDTMEDPASGGVNGFSVYPAPTTGSGTLAGGVVAVGQACSGPAARSIFSWNAYCWGEVWRSPDGLAWSRGDAGPQTRGGASTVAVVEGHAILDAPICFDDCPSAIMASEDGNTWDVAYGSPVGGTLMALVAAEGRFFSAVATPVPETGLATLVFWVSDEGSDWRLANAQPMLPADAMSFHHVAMTVAGDRLMVVASGEVGADPELASIALLSPPVASMG